MKKSSIILLLLLIAVGTFGYFLGRGLISKSNQLTKQPTSSKENQIGTYIKLANNGVYFTQDKIYIHGFVEDNKQGFTIEKAKYPKLFDNIGSFWTAEEINDQMHNKQFILISVNSNSHGGYQQDYGIFVDPDDRSVVYETPDALAASQLSFITYLNQGSVIELELNPYHNHINNSCTSCGLMELEFVTYDPTIKKYILANNKFQSDFKQLLDQYNTVAIQGCWYKGKIQPFSEIEKNDGKNVKCPDSILPTPQEDPDFMTLGQFDNIRANIQKIVNGENISML